MTKAPTRGLRLFRTCWPRRVGASKLPDPRGPIAQRLEQGTHNPLVPGSNPGGPTIPRADVLLRTRDYPSGMAGRLDLPLLSACQGARLVRNIRGLRARFPRDAGTPSFGPFAVVARRPSLSAWVMS